MHGSVSKVVRGHRPQDAMANVIVEPVLKLMSWNVGVQPGIWSTFDHSRLVEEVLKFPWIIICPFVLVVVVIWDGAVGGEIIFVPAAQVFVHGSVLNFFDLQLGFRRWPFKVFSVVLIISGQMVVKCLRAVLMSARITASCTVSRPTVKIQVQQEGHRK